MGVEYYYLRQAEHDKISVRFAKFMEEFEKKMNELTSRASKRTNDLLLEEATAYAELCEDIFRIGEPNTAYLEVLRGREDRLARIGQNQEQLDMEGDDIVEWTSKEITALVKSLVADPRVLDEHEQTLSDYSDQEHGSEEMTQEMLMDSTQE
jgi:hypothetical protein